MGKFLPQDIFTLFLKILHRPVRFYWYIMWCYDLCLLVCFLFCVSSFSFSCFFSSVWGRVLEERNKKLEEELRKEKEVSQIFIHAFDFTWFPPGGDLAGGEMLVQPVWFLIRGPVQADAHCGSCRDGGGIAKVLKSMSFWFWRVEDGRSMDGRWWFMKWRLLMMVVVDMILHQLFWSRFDFTLWSCSFWLLVLNVELDLLGITKMMLDGSKSNSRWCSFLGWIILHVCIRLYQILILCWCVSWSVSVAPMAGWQGWWGGDNFLGGTQTESLIFVHVFVCKFW